MSRQRRASIATVVQACRLLEDRGLIEARPQSGYCVRAAAASSAEPAISQPPRGARLVGVQALVDRVLQDAARADVFPLGAGGFVLWVEMPGVDSASLYERAFDEGIGVAPGAMFTASDRCRDCIRLNCGLAWSERTERAVRRLGELACELQQKAPHTGERSGPRSRTLAPVLQGARRRASEQPARSEREASARLAQRLPSAASAQRMKRFT